VLSFLSLSFCGFVLSLYVLSFLSLILWIFIAISMLMMAKWIHLYLNFYILLS
jgi:hypothetical protein